MALVTWNPVNPNIIYSNGNLTAEGNIDSEQMAIATLPRQLGQYYWEVTIDQESTLGGDDVGMTFASANVNNFVGDAGFGYRENGMHYVFGTPAAYGDTWGLNDVIGLGVNLSNGELEYFKNGVSQGIAPHNLGLIANWSPAAAQRFGIKTVNYGASPFAFGLPAGYLPWDQDTEYSGTILNCDNDINRIVRAYRWDTGILLDSVTIDMTVTQDYTLTSFEPREIYIVSIPENFGLLGAGRKILTAGPFTTA